MSSSVGISHGAGDEDAEEAAILEKKKEDKRFAKSVRRKMKGITDKKVRTAISKSEYAIRAAEDARERASLLLPGNEAVGYIEPETELERTYKVNQSEIFQSVDLETQSRMFSLNLALGPYLARYSRNGRSLLLAGRTGHCAVTGWKEHALRTEVQLKDEIFDSAFLSSESLFATAQRKYAYIYDQDGVQLHVLRRHIAPRALEYLPYHFLLASIGEAGWLKYQDVSTGEMVVEHRTKLGSCSVLRQNPNNAILCLGHENGTVTMWSPNLSGPIAKILCHRGALRALAVDREGRYLVTAGADSQMKVWDVRTFKELFAYGTLHPASSLDISQRGLLACGYGAHVQVWGRDCLVQKQQSPYLSRLFEGDVVQSVRFCPYEDFLGVGHSRGFTSLSIPGSGDPSFDSYEENPFETKKQSSESEVVKVLEKIPASMITLDPSLVGTVDTVGTQVKKVEREEWMGIRKKKDVQRTREPTKSSIRKEKTRRKHNIVIREREKRVMGISARERLIDEKAKLTADPAADSPALRRLFDKKRSE